MTGPSDFSFGDSLPQYPFLAAFDGTPPQGQFTSERVSEILKGNSRVVVADGESDDISEARMRLHSLGQTLSASPPEIPLDIVLAGHKAGGEDTFEYTKSLYERAFASMGYPKTTETGDSVSCDNVWSVVRGGPMRQKTEDQQREATEAAERINAALTHPYLLQVDTSAAVAYKLDLSNCVGVTMTCATTPTQNGMIPGWNAMAAKDPFFDLVSKCQEQSIPLVLGRLSLLNIGMNSEGDIPGYDQLASASLHPDEANRFHEVFDKTQKETLVNHAWSLQYLSGMDRETVAESIKKTIDKALTAVYGDSPPDYVKSWSTRPTDPSEYKDPSPIAVTVYSRTSPHVARFLGSDYIADVVDSAMRMPGVSFVPIKVERTEGGISFGPSTDPNNIVYMAVAPSGLEEDFKATIPDPLQFYSALAAADPTAETVLVVGLEEAKSFRAYSLISKEVIEQCLRHLDGHEGLSKTEKEQASEIWRQTLDAFESGPMTLISEQRYKDAGLDWDIEV